MFTLLIKNSTIIDGSGQPSFRSDIGISGNRIEVIGNLSGCSSEKIIDAKKLTVSPGFIDFHSHDDLQVLKDPLLKPKISQGITTEVVGNCGFSVAPISQKSFLLFSQYIKSMLGEYQQWKWKDMREYFAFIKKWKISVNIASYVGHNTLRASVMDFNKGHPTLSQLNLMKNLLDRMMTQGAVGLSSGLLYLPGCYSNLEEVIELCRVVGKWKGFYSTHMRNESTKIEESIKETLKIGKEANIPVHVSHLKIVGKRNWFKFEKVLSIIEEAIREGQEISFDVYPYVAGSTTLTALLPQWSLEGGMEKLIERLKQKDIRLKIKRQLRKEEDWENISKSSGWENIFISAVYSPENSSLEGRNIQEIADSIKKDPVDVLFDLIIQEKGQVIMLNFSMREEDLREFLKHPKCVIGTDAILTGEKVHPRGFGTFPKVLRKYVMEEKLLTWEEAIHKMTYLPARTLSMPEIGLIRPRMFADIVIFNPSKIRDKATFSHPVQYPEGIHYVINSGKIVFDNGTFTELRPGRILKRKF